LAIKDGSDNSNIKIRANHKPRRPLEEPIDQSQNLLNPTESLTGFVSVGSTVTLCSSDSSSMRLLFSSFQMSNDQKPSVEVNSPKKNIELSTDEQSKSKVRARLRVLTIRRISSLPPSD